MKNVSFQLLLLVSLLVLVFRHDLVEGRTMHTNRGSGDYHDHPCNPSDPKCDKPCNPENPNCRMKQGVIEPNRGNGYLHDDPPCNPNDPKCDKPCDPENPNC
ncbi:unnamed protein product [Arabidopsis lyrata]|uniref:Uncharacterized protein n=1 Tax=Arabidopsis lyrata subsp. lyrata TaxID=81972 RepID=D7L3U8_ARALL|nr:sporozoite surface protein 2 [Arabidopsis lyrata subsp. lyrata]EFH58675.1 hypothetical protein ARALYDRAFT_477834 [Arabidopsis lyrata subsp. lyrata]CAH8259446.1 unnamed protein product [Arabidopsis lyrata]|eukprot:XP_020888650.1 sporozoite surface protein 2 [Arabidopsis lyrata subsp. lyrata]